MLQLLNQDDGVMPGVGNNLPEKLFWSLGLNHDPYRVGIHLLAARCYELSAIQAVYSEPQGLLPPDVDLEIHSGFMPKDRLYSFS